MALLDDIQNKVKVQPKKQTTQTSQESTQSTPSIQLRVGRTVTGAPGTPANVAIQQNTLSFIIPEGLKGDTGIPGPAGASLSPIDVLDDTSQLPSDASVGDCYVIAGDLWAFNLSGDWVNLGALRGPAGPAGANGAPGLAATISVGTVTTGAPGSNATVVNVGNTSNAIFNFTIPRGADGTGGTGGGGASVLDDLTDVTITTPASGHFLRYNGTAWVNTLLVAGDIPNLDWAKITTGKPTTLGGYGITDAVNTSTYTAADVLSKLLTVDGPGSGLNADLLDGNDSAYFTNAGNLNAGTLLAARMPALTGDVTTSAGGVTTTIGAGVVSLSKMANVATGTVFYRKTAGTGAPEVQTLATLKTDLAITKSDVGLGSVENTALSTWAGSANITTLGTIATGTWNATAIADGKIASVLTGKTYNGLTLTAAAVGFTIAGGTTSKTLTVGADASVSGTNTGDQTITLTGDVTGSGTGSFVATIAAKAVSLAKLADVATGTVFYRKTAGAGSPEVQTLATLKTDLAITKNDVGLGSVENTALSTWVGSTSLTTLGTITTGAWNGSVIGPAYLGTGTRDGTKFLRDDGTWQAVAGGSSALSGLSDVTITTVASGNFLRYNGTKWVNTNLVAGDIPNLDWSKITSGTPTTLAGYGITDAVGQTGNQTMTGVKTLDVTGAGSAPWIIYSDDSITNPANSMTFRRRNAGAAVAASQRLGGMLFLGYYDATNLGAGAGIESYSEEAYTSTAQGTYIQFATTATGASTRTARWRMYGAGHFIPIADASYDIGDSTHSVRQLYVGTVAASGELQSTTTNGLRLVQGNYGVLFRNDGTNFWLLNTASADQYGSYGALRPFSFNLSTGQVTMANGVSVTGGGLDFGSQLGASNSDVSKHISLYSTTYGFSITSTRLNYVVPSTAFHKFLVNGVDIFSIGATAVTSLTPTLGDNSTNVATTAFVNTPNVQSVTSAATVTPTAGNDMVIVTAQAAALALANPTGTWLQGQGLVIRVKDNGTARAISFGTSYRAVGVTLPTTTVISKTLYIGIIYNATDSKWDVVSVGQE